MKPVYHSILALEPLRLIDAPEPVTSLDFLGGAILTGLPPAPWVFEVEADGPRLPHLVGGPFPMASDRLLDVLTTAGVDNIQTFPALLRLRGWGEWRQHSVLNVIGVVDAADVEASEGTVLAEGESGPTRIAFRNLVLSRARTLGLPVFRLSHDPATLLVSDRILSALNRHRPPEGWGFAAIEIDVTDG